MTTLKQRQARARNWRIRTLRALHALAQLLTEPRQSAVRALIDEELASLGAETAAARMERLIRECRE